MKKTRQSRTQSVRYGGSGFIGSEVIRRLLAEGCSVKALMRKTSLDANLKGLEFERAIGDLSDLASLKEAVKDVDYVFHLAGLTSAKSKEDYFTFNQQGTANLAIACAEANPNLKRFIYVSSLAASGPSDTLTPRVETDFEKPISAYGLSKLGGEKELLKIAEGKFAISIVRPPAVYGPKDRDIFEFFNLVNKGWMPMLPTYNPTKQKHYSLVHVEDLVEGLVQAAFSESLGKREVFFIAGDEISSYEEIMKEIALVLGKKPFRFRVFSPMLSSIAGICTGLSKLTGKRFPITLDKLNELRPDFWICSNKHAKSKIGFKPKFSFSKGIEHTAKWYKDNGWLK